MAPTKAEAPGIGPPQDIPKYFHGFVDPPLTNPLWECNGSCHGTAYTTFRKGILGVRRHLIRSLARFRKISARLLMLSAIIPNHSKGRTVKSLHVLVQVS
jgi:hypothetical protein